MVKSDFSKLGAKLPLSFYKETKQKWSVLDAVRLWNHDIYMHEAKRSTEYATNNNIKTHKDATDTVKVTIEDIYDSPTLDRAMSLVKYPTTWVHEA